ncbi:MAG: ParB/RepB/Spo0J family partition protein [Anaerolineae bacterium]|nr:ParB/RepB/Spo0J family partition protein [Anaerolineae bacterium]
MASRQQRKSAVPDRRPAPSSNPNSLRAGLVEASTERRWLELSKIVRHPDLQVRVGDLDEDNLIGIMSSIEKGKDLPVVGVFEVNGEYLLVDGYHRAEAYHRLDIGMIEAKCYVGTFADARRYAEEANMDHGMQLSMVDKRAIWEYRVREGFYTNEEGALASNADMASGLRVHKDTIRNWLAELATDDFSSVDLTKRTGKDGRTINVTKIQETTAQRAEAERERRAAEEAEAEHQRRAAFEEQVRAEAERFATLRALPVIGKVKYIAERLMARVYNSEIAVRLGEPFKEMSLPDEQKRLGYYRQVANTRYKFKPQDEERLNQEMKLAHPYTWYQSLLDLPPHIWEQAEREAWDEDAMQAWLASFYKNQTGQQVGMAQPKNPDLPYQPPAATGRHRLTEVAATESETPNEIPPIKTPPRTRHDTPPDDQPCPFGLRDIVRYFGFHTNNQNLLGEVKAIDWNGYGWFVTFIAENHLIYKGYSDEFELVGAAPQSTTPTDDAPDALPTPSFSIGLFMELIEDGGLLGPIAAMEPNSDGEWWYEIDGEWYAEHELRPATSPQLKNPPVTVYDAPNGKRQAEMMVQDARSLIPVLLIETMDGARTFRQRVLVRWEAPKSVQTILEHGDAKEIKLVKRETETTIGELKQTIKEAQVALSRCQAIVHEIEVHQLAEQDVKKLRGAS